MSELTLIENPTYFMWVDENYSPHSPDNETPALWSKDGGYKMWYHHGLFHRLNGLPAVVYDRDEDDDRNEWWFMGWRHRYRQFGPASEFVKQPQYSQWIEWEVFYDADGNHVPTEWDPGVPDFLENYTDDELGKNGPIYPTPTPTPSASPVVEPEPTPEPTVAAKKSRKTS